MRYNKGLTLIEIMITIAVSLIIFSGLFAALISGRNSWFSGDTYIELQQELRRAKESLVKDIAQASYSTFNIVSNNTLYCDIPSSIEDGGNITWEQIAYVLTGVNNSQLVRTDSAIQKVLANNISSITYAQDVNNRRLVYVTILVSKQNLTRQTFNHSLSFHVKLRN